MRLKAILKEAEAEQESRGLSVVRDLTAEAQAALSESALSRLELDFEGRYERKVMGRYEGKEGHAYCVICLHPERKAIERDFINARGKYGPVAAIMRKYGIKHSASLYDHARATGLDAKRVQFRTLSV